MKNKTSYAKITAKIIFITMVCTLLVLFVYAEYMKKNAITKLAHVDAKKTSMLVFESLYSVMQRGWNRDDINEVIDRLNRVDSVMSVNVYRSALVAGLYGEIQKDKNSAQKSQLVADAMRGREVLNITDENNIEYYYPVIAKDKCLSCHSNAVEGDVLGTIEVSYPVENLQVSFSELINIFMIFFVVFSCVIFLLIFFELNRYIIVPIKRFSDTIKAITNSHDVKKRVLVDDNIEELDSIKDTFNSMLDSLEHQFYSDSLTGLQNRKRLAEDLEKSANSFLMILNIDSFGEINDLYGDTIGDSVLKDFAQFLKNNLFGSGNLYRLHADEFAYLCNLPKDIDNFLKNVELLIEKISKARFNIDDKTEVSISATIGIASNAGSVSAGLYTSTYDATLLANADIALKLAKKSKKHFLIYDETMAMAKEYEKNLEWAKRIKHAIENDKIVPVFQAMMDIEREKIVKYESLMRMVDFNGSLIAPIHFLELAKKNKLYNQLTKIMIEKTFEKFESLECSVSINVSLEDILNTETYDFILTKLKESSLRERVVFEIIESEGIESFDEVLEFIKDVKSYGAKISIDDFGTGYSNFEYLMKLQVDYIKIDGSMIRSIDKDKNAQMVTEIIVSFAKKMNIKCVAEFVHSKDVYEKVKELGVDYAQGYYIGEPNRDIGYE